VSRILVNGRPAKATAADFAQWEITLPVPTEGEIKLSAQAVDVFGAVEPRPHRLLLRRTRDSNAKPGRAGATVSVTNLAPEAKPTACAATPEPGRRSTGETARPEQNRSDLEALQGTWQLVAQQRAGRATGRPKNMRWVIQGNTIWLVVDRGEGPPPKVKVPAQKSAGQAGKGKQADFRRGLQMTFQLDPARAPKRIDLDGPRKGASLGIYKLDGDALTLCMGGTQPSPTYDKQARSDESTRPSAISPEAGTILVLRRLRD
jgi:uncharacterized protein (TIGR03067 family)